MNLARVSIREGRLRAWIDTSENRREREREERAVEARGRKGGNGREGRGEIGGVRERGSRDVKGIMRWAWLQSGLERSSDAC